MEMINEIVTCITHRNGGKRQDSGQDWKVPESICSFVLDLNRVRTLCRGTAMAFSSGEPADLLR